MLPRWQQAFPKATVTHGDDPAVPSQLPDLVWLRLRQGFPVAEQVFALRARFGDIACIVLSDIPDNEQALDAFAASARGYCNSHSTPEVLQRAAAVVLQGGVWIGEVLMQRLVALVARAPVPPAADGRHWTSLLTEREREVAETIAAGASNKEIAHSLGITERTVKAHVGAILTKLQVRDRLQLALVIGGRQKLPG